MPRILNIFVITTTLLVSACYDEDILEGEYFESSCDENVTQSPGDFKKLAGEYTLAVSNSKHGVFPMGESRTEYQFEICQEGKVLIYNSDGEMLKSLLYQSNADSSVTPSDISIENFYDVNPFHERFLFGFSLNDNADEDAPTVFAEYETYIEGKTGWSSSANIRGKGIPLELTEAAGEYTLESEEEAVTLTITNGAIQLQDQHNEIIAATHWDGDFDSVSLDEENSKVTFFINEESIFPQYKFEFDLLEESITELQMQLDEDKNLYYSD